MNKLQLTLALCGLIATGVQAEDWQLAKDEAGIKVYLSSMPGSQYKAYRAVTSVNADIQKLLALQADVKGSCTWIFECQEQTMLKATGAENWLYARFSAPWPVTARDSVLHVTTTVAADGTVTRLLQALPEYLPKDKDYVRVTRVDGFWTLQPKAAGKVEVVYQAHMEPGGSVPSWLANSFVVDAPFNTLQAFRQAAEKP
ncbi:MAG: START domain-containing protein [Pseudomonas sp.]|uniref:START domain-containing protein n=1 Tax=Pseudomonas sp. TaxID=306 RepID=UPI0027327F34|nr:START domain-containing protein [Pseudomonas sp.]MDP3845953.1 START domain-containing protein [Pseudomonas sp.]